MMKEKGATIGRFAGSSIIALTLGLAAPAFAEDQPAQPAQAAPAPQSAGAEDDATSSIVVTGFRASLNQALDIKRESTAAVDSLIAEDIAQFSEQKLAETLQRIPRVSHGRGAGSRKSTRLNSRHYSAFRMPAFA